MDEIYTISGILQRLKNVKKSGDGKTARCPAHEDNQNSLSIRQTADKLMLHCHAGCTVNDVCAALGIEVKDLFTSKSARGKGAAKRIAATYEYVDENGKLLFQSVRSEPKSFSQRRPEGNGWTWNLGNVRRVPYRLQELLASKEAPVYIVEGEKDVDRLRSLDLTATTNPQGALKWRDEYSEYLTNRVCYIFPDNDETGRKHVAQVAKSLLGKAKEIRIVTLPDLAEKGDVSDWLDAGHTTEELKASAENSPLWTGEIIDAPETNPEEQTEDLKMLTASLFGDALTLEITSEGRKQKVIAKNNSGVLAMDVFNLAESVRRAKFVKSLSDYFDDKQREEILRALLDLADRTSELPAFVDHEDKETITTSFIELPGGVILEQIRGGFAVYIRAEDKYSIVESYRDSDGVTYIPDLDELLTGDGGLTLADDLTEYGSEAELDAETEAFLYRFSDMSELHRKMAAKYIRFTYLFDRTYELAYIAMVGDPGTGKTRGGESISFVARRGMTVVNPSAASLFRIIDKYQPTLFIDEMNLADTGDDTMAILQVLNSGVKKNTGYVPRLEKAADGNFQTKLYKTFCPKIIGSLKKTNSAPFNSRCIQIEMEATKRTDIPFRTTSAMLADAQVLRNKLTLYRLRNYSKNFEQKLDEAETKMKTANLRPRTIQVNTALLALTDDETLQNDFLNLLRNADRVRASEKLETLDGEIAQAIHELIFETDVAPGAPIEVKVYFEHGKLCQDLRVEQILEIVNADRKEKDKLDARRMGQLLNKNLKIRTGKILSRTNHRDKKAIVFDCEVLGKLFEKFSLLGFPAETCHQCHQQNNPNTVNSLLGDKSFQTEIDLSPNNSNECNTYGLVTSGDKSFLNSREKESFSSMSPASNASSNPLDAKCKSCGSLTSIDVPCASCGEWNIPF